MNAGFEDCTLLNEILNKTNDNISKSIELFTKERVKDAHAISDLAHYNYVEMRDLVNSPLYNARKQLDEYLFKIIKDKWTPLYVSVTFSDMSYSECITNRKQQNRVNFKFYFS